MFKKFLMAMVALCFLTICSLPAFARGGGARAVDIERIAIDGGGGGNRVIERLPIDIDGGGGGGRAIEGAPIVIAKADKVKPVKPPKKGTKGGGGGGQLFNPGDMLLFGGGGPN